MLCYTDGTFKTDEVSTTYTTLHVGVKPIDARIPLKNGEQGVQACQPHQA